MISFWEQMKEKLEDAGMDNADAYESDDEIHAEGLRHYDKASNYYDRRDKHDKEEMLDINHRLNGIRKKRKTLEQCFFILNVWIDSFLKPGGSENDQKYVDEGLWKINFTERPTRA